MLTQDHFRQCSPNIDVIVELWGVSTKTEVCRFCGCPQEAILHLLSDCAGTHSFRVNHNINNNILVQEVPSSLLKIVRFDVWIRQMVPYDTMPLGFWTQSTLNALDNEEKRSRIDDNSNENQRPKKKDALVILDRSLSSTIHHTKIQRIDKDLECLLYALLVHSTSLDWLWQERVYFF